MEPENEPLEKEIPIKNHNFQPPKYLGRVDLAVAWLTFHITSASWSHKTPAAEAEDGCLKVAGTWEQPVKHWQPCMDFHSSCTQAGIRDSSAKDVWKIHPPIPDLQEGEFLDPILARNTNFSREKT